MSDILIHTEAGVTTVTLNRVDKKNSITSTMYAALADALDVDMADWWQATPATYFDSVSKAQLIEAGTEACGADAAKPMATQKKAEAVAYAAAKLEGKRWLPRPLRRDVTAKSAA